MPKLDVTFGSSTDVDGTEQEYLGRRAGRQGLRDWPSTLDGGDLVLSQSDVLAKECLRV
jgi:hypothetical protein